MDKAKWRDIVEDKNNAGKWFALTDCDYVEDELDSCVVVDEDANLAALEERLATQGIESCIIKYCGEDQESSENPRIQRTTIVTKPQK